jgi:uroporphyrinogen III methyltransferase / synthase
MSMNTGKVFLVGAGPGDKGLITLKGAKLLSEADCIIHDALVNPALLQHAKPEAEIIFGGKKPRCHTMSQQALNEMLVEKAKQGKKVVRLKGGDPFIFGRGGEEALALHEAGIFFEVVPGISSVNAVPAYAGIPLTHRHLSSCYSVFTGRSNPDQKMPDYPWETIARTPGTKVLLMCVERLKDIADELMEHGLSASTPAAMISWGTYGKQKSIAGTIGTLADISIDAGITSPSIVIIGEVVTLRGTINWYERKPLFGRKVVVTRAPSLEDSLTVRLAELGADVLQVPVLRSDVTTRSRELVESILGIGEYDWIVFTSVRGVDAFFEAFFKAYKDIRSIGNVRIAAVGPATAERIQRLRLTVDAMPSNYRADKIMSAIQEHESVENIRIMLARAEVANPDLPKELEKNGAIIDDVACYRTISETRDPHETGEKLQNDGADWLTFTSGSAVQHFHDRFDLPDLLETYPELKVASIGPETSKSLESIKVQITVEAAQHTGEGLAHAITEFELRSTDEDQSV